MVLWRSTNNSNNYTNATFILFLLQQGDYYHERKNNKYIKNATKFPAYFLPLH